MNGSQWKQRIIDDYLNQSGNNRFVPSEFLAWLKDRPGHECHDVFFGMSDADAAAAYREDLVRRWVSGLRVVVRTEDEDSVRVGVVNVRECTLPLMHSPVDARKDGGGYVHTNPNDQDHLAEIARQGAVALAAWIERYEGTARLLGVDTSAASSIRVSLDAAAAAALVREEAA